MKRFHDCIFRGHVKKLNYDRYLIKREYNMKMSNLVFDKHIESQVQNHELSTGFQDLYNDDLHI